MKRLMFAGLMLLGAAGFLSAQVDFYGDFTSSLYGNIPGFEKDKYDSLLNPDNRGEINDLALANSLVVKLSGGDGTADLELWFSLSQYPLGAALLGIDRAAGLGGYAASEISAFAGDHIYTFDLQRGAVSWYMGDNVRFKLGRQSMLTGYGYGWNPIDFANPLKDPADPDADLKGVDALQVHLFPFSAVNVKLCGLYDRALYEEGADYIDLMAGGEITMDFSFAEVKATGLYEADRNPGEDNRTTAAGLGFLTDMAGLGVYGEGAMLAGSRNPFVGDSGGLMHKGGPLFLGLAGLEYTFPFELTAAAEYFYNGEGYDLGERQDIKEALELMSSAGGPTAEYLAMYRPGYYSRHYVLLNLAYPLYDANMDLVLTNIYSPDSGAYSLLPMLSWYASGSLTLEISYSGFFSLIDRQADENFLSPVKQVIAVQGKYSF